MNGQVFKLLALVLVILGAGLLIWGFQLSSGTANEITRSLTGSHSDAVMYRYIGGAISLAAGAFLFLKSK
jgi:hypothetical protein